MYNILCEQSFKSTVLWSIKLVLLSILKSSTVRWAKLLASCMAEWCWCWSMLLLQSFIQNPVNIQYLHGLYDIDMIPLWSDHFVSFCKHTCRDQSLPFNGKVMMYYIFIKTSFLVSKWHHTDVFKARRVCWIEMNHNSNLIFNLFGSWTNFAQICKIETKLVKFVDLFDYSDSVRWNLK